MTSAPSFIWLDSVDSTNTEIYRQICKLDNLSVIAAVNQTAGRGQRGNVWSVEPGTNLTFSILLKFGDNGLPPLPALDQFAISEAVTLGLTDFFSDEGIAAKIKWPNDIYVRNRKLTGILIENSLEGKFLKSSIVGIGVNCNQREFPPHLPNPTSMTLLNGRHYDNLPTLLEKLVGFILPYLEMTASREGIALLKEKYLGRLYRSGETHEFSDCLSGEVFKAEIVGVSDLGMLQVRKENGETKEFAFKEINYIL